MISTLFKRLFATVLLAVVASSFSACGLFSGPRLEAKPTPTLAELPKARNHLRQLREASESSDAVESSNEALLAEVSNAYHEALALAAEPAVRQEIQRRLAHIDLQMAEEQQINHAEADPKTIYRTAIEGYLALLAAYQDQSLTADAQSIDELLYPLAKAYEMSGDIPNALTIFDRLVNEVPESRYYSEAQFRRAEILFANGDYRDAGSAYRAVIARATETEQQRAGSPAPFLMNSWYMAGWSDFKLGRYNSALKAFFVVMDKNAMLFSEPVEQPLSGAMDTDLRKPASLSSQQALLDDTLRVMSLAFSYESGSSSIASLLDELYRSENEPIYVDKLYADLARLYLEKKRFADSADTYAAYINRYPDSMTAPQFHVQMIAVYVEGGFPDKVREEKQQYVAAYGVRSDYWAAATSEQRQGIQKDLNVYINELASYYHNLAQAKTYKGKTLSAAEVRDYYRQAGDWYKEWIISLPNAPDLDRVWFLLGETRFESQDFSAAIVAYENAAYGNFGSIAETQEGERVDGADTDLEAADSVEPFSQQNEAGYAALLSYDRLIASLESGESSLQSSPEPSPEPSLEPSIEQWQMDKNDSALLFAQTFPNDARSIPVLAQTTESLLALAQYEKTIEVGQGLLLRLDSNLEADASSISSAEREQYQITGGLAVAHAERALAHHELAEQGYYRVVAQLDTMQDSPLYQQYYAATLDNYAASIYQQGVSQMDAGDAVLAADSFMRVVAQAGGSSIRLAAQRDAAALYMQTEQWQKAIDVLSDFQQRFPHHEAASGIPARLLLANQSLENWGGAAAQAMVLAKSDKDPAVRQQALYSAAEFYQQADDDANAIESYRSYANTYKEPLAEVMEAQFRLTELYAKSAELDKLSFWLKKLITTHKAAAQPSDRSRYLAAFAATDMAEKTLQAYHNIRLNHPLKASLAKKRRAMQATLAAYEEVASYDVQEFSIQSTHRIGDIYASLASDLMASERPAGLNELELEQYNFLLEEQAYPFEESAIEFYSVNVERAWQGIHGDWVKDSYQALATLLPGRFDKSEIRPGAAQ